MERPWFCITEPLEAIKHYWIPVVDHIYHGISWMCICASSGFILDTAATGIHHNLKYICDYIVSLAWSESGYEQPSVANY